VTRAVEPSLVIREQDIRRGRAGVVPGREAGLERRGAGRLEQEQHAGGHAAVQRLEVRDLAGEAAVAAELVDEAGQGDDVRFVDELEATLAFCG